jgi:hypothetical protein
MTELNEKAVAKAADAVNKENGEDAAAALHNALTQIPFEEQVQFLKAVESKNHANKHSVNALDVMDVPGYNAPVAYLWGFDKNSHKGDDYVIVTPGNTVSEICMSNYVNFRCGEEPTGKQVQDCIKGYKENNNLADVNKIEAGQVLIMPKLQY